MQMCVPVHALLPWLFFPNLDLTLPFAPSYQLLLASRAAGYSYLCQPVNYSNDVNEVRVSSLACTFHWANVCTHPHHVCRNLYSFNKSWCLRGSAIVHAAFPVPNRWGNAVILLLTLRRSLILLGIRVGEKQRDDESPAFLTGLILGQRGCGYQSHHELELHPLLQLTALVGLE